MQGPQARSLLFFNCPTSAAVGLFVLSGMALIGSCSPISSDELAPILSTMSCASSDTTLETAVWQVTSLDRSLDRQTVLFSDGCLQVANLSLSARVVSEVRTDSISKVKADGRLVALKAKLDSQKSVPTIAHEITGKLTLIDSAGETRSAHLYGEKAIGKISDVLTAATTEKTNTGRDGESISEYYLRCWPVESSRSEIIKLRKKLQIKTFEEVSEYFGADLVNRCTARAGALHPIPFVYQVNNNDSHVFLKKDRLIELDLFKQIQ